MDINLKIVKIFLLVLIIISSQNFLKISRAVEPNEILDNKKQETRAREISKNIRCMICQNQSIDDSDAPLAKDLRILIREKIKEGYLDDEIYNFLTARYGDFILLKPPLKLETLILWFFPFALLIISFFIFFIYKKKTKKDL
tara:strand:- start:335 stop:760 length:426 start_codon:yes stop_codon:yes gene_type:complete